MQMAYHQRLEQKRLTRERAEEQQRLEATRQEQEYQYQQRL